MSKSVLKGAGGLDTLIPNKSPETKELNEIVESSGYKKTTKGRPKTQNKVVINTSEDGTKAGEIRATFIVNKELLAKFKAIAYWERAQIKVLMNNLLSEYIDKYEKKNGKIKGGR